MTLIGIFVYFCDSRLEILKSVGSKLVKPTVGCGELCAQTLLSFMCRSQFTFIQQRKP